MIRTVIALIGFGLSIGVFVVYTRPTYDGLQGIQNTIAQYDMALSRATELQKLKKNLFERYDTFNPADVERLHKLLPDHVDNVRLVLDFDSMATRHRMPVQNVVVNSTAEKDKTPTIGGTTSALKYDSITLRFSTDGTYADFISFLSELESSLRIVDVITLSVTPGPLVTGSPEPLYHYDVTVRTYWLR